MAQAAKVNKDGSDRVDGFALLEPVGKLASYPKRFRAFLHEVRVEMRQVNWPSRQNVISTTLVVALTVAFFGVYFFFTDLIFGNTIKWLIDYAKKL
ncbi:MAG: preprotein translocase subunit SecE [Candidatus Acidiferrales bacterium]